MSDETNSSKPFHLMTPAERTALRIAQNRAINERIANNPAATKTSRAKSQRPPEKSGTDFIRATPEERAELKIGSLIRKVQS